MERFVQKYFKTYIAIACIGYFAILFALGNGYIMWYDDVAQLGMINEPNILSMLRECRASDNMPPLSHLLDYIWIRLVPYSPRMIKLPCILFSALGVYFAALSSKEAFGELAGAITATVLIANEVVVSLGAYTFRAYGLYFGFAGIVLYTFVRTNDGNMNRLCHVLAMIGLVYSHYFGILIVFLLGILDIAINRKNKWIKIFLTYVAVAISIAPWILYVLRSSLDKITKFWPDVPGIKDYFDAILTLNAAHRIWIAALLIGIVVAVFRCKEDGGERVIGLVLLPFAMLLMVFALSNIGGEVSSLWVMRYFLGIVPFFAFGIGYGAESFKNVICDITKGKFQLLYSFGYGLLIVLGLAYALCRIYRIDKENIAYNSLQNYEISLEYLANCEDINDENTVVLMPDLDSLSCMGAAYDYLMRQFNETATTVRFVSSLENVDLDLIDKVYVLELRFDPSAEDLANIKAASFVGEKINGVNVINFVRSN